MTNTYTMARRLSLLVANGLTLASAASWNHDNNAAGLLQASTPTEDGPLADKVAFHSQAAQKVMMWYGVVVPTAHTPCVADLPGGRWVAGSTMVGGIALTAGVSVALLCYLMRNRPTLPGPAGPAAPAAATDNRPSGDTAGGEPPAKKKRVYMYTLDGLRTLLVTAVIFAHYPIGLPAIAKHLLGWPMQFFFVLSGFVAQCQQNEQFNLHTGLTYIVRRLFRILPLYQLALVFQYALAIYAGRDCQPVGAWPMNALLMQVIFPVPLCGAQDWAWTQGYTHFNGNGPAWFAACIVWFSCLFPLLYNLKPKSNGLWGFGLLVALIACRAVPELVNPKWGTYGGGPHLYAMSPIRLMEFMAGMWAAQVATDVAKRWGEWGGWCWLFDASLVMLVSLIYITLVYVGATWTCSGDYHLTAICCLVCGVAKLAAEMPEESREGVGGAVLHRIVGSTALSYLARFSFPAYIFQTSFMGFTQGTQDFYIHRFILLWAFSIFATLYIEEPMIAVVQAKLKGEPKAVK